MKTCQANKCKNPVFGKGYCKLHQRFRPDKKGSKKQLVNKKPLPSLRLLKAKAVKLFHNYIRERDKALGCISCDGPVQQAGHYMNAGQHSALKFDELNVHGQCIACNCYKHGNLIRYRQGLVKRIGETAVQELENTANLIKKWTRYDLEEIILTYTKKKAA